MQPRIGPRAEYRQQENLRIQSSASLADRFQKLKSLTVDLAFFNPAGVSKNSEMKYRVNLTHGKSIFRIDCNNSDCVGGDFDLSRELAEAVATGQTTVSREISCQGWLNKTTIDRVHCHHILRYKLNLEYCS